MSLIRAKKSYGNPCFVSGHKAYNECNDATKDDETCILTCSDG